MAWEHGLNYIMKESNRYMSNTPYRGYLSTMQIDPHFGLGDVSIIDSIIIKWPDGKKQVLQNVSANQTITVDIKNANDSYSLESPCMLHTNALFKDVTDSVDIHYTA